jgi:hypothetical protein
MRCTLDGTAIVPAGPTWFQRHLHILVMWSLAVLAGDISGFWWLTACAVSYELLHQCVHARKEQHNDWRSSDWAGEVAIAMSLVTGLTAASKLAEMDPALSTGVILLYLAGQYLVSTCAHRNARGHRRKYGSTLLANWRFALIGLGVMAIGVWSLMEAKKI